MDAAVLRAESEPFQVASSLREPYKTRRTELRIGLADRFGRRCAGVGTSTEPWYWHPAYGPTQSLRNIRY